MPGMAAICWQGFTALGTRATARAGAWGLIDRGCRKVVPFVWWRQGGGNREGKRGREESCPVGCGFYEDSRALLIALDFVMPPAGKGPLSGGPLHPRAPGGAAPLVPPGCPAPHSYAGQLPCGAGAPRAICPAECNVRNAPAGMAKGGCLLFHTSCGAHPRRRSFRRAKFFAFRRRTRIGTELVGRLQDTVIVQRPCYIRVTTGAKVEPLASS
jgi:hypothetical protein